MEEGKGRWWVEFGKDLHRKSLNKELEHRRALSAIVTRKLIGARYTRLAIGQDIGKPCGATEKIRDCPGSELTPPKPCSEEPLGTSSPRLAPTSPTTVRRVWCIDVLMYSYIHLLRRASSILTTSHCRSGLPCWLPIGESILGGLLDLRLGCGEALALWHVRFMTGLRGKSHYSRSSPLPFPPPLIYQPQHLLPALSRIHSPPSQTHTHLLIRPRRQQLLQQQMPHVQTHKYSTITAVFLLRTVLQWNELDHFVE